MDVSINATSVSLVMFSAKFETSAFNFSTCQYVSLIEDEQPAATCFVTPNSLITEQLQHLFFYVYGSVHRNINLIERANKMQPCS